MHFEGVVRLINAETFILCHSVALCLAAFETKSEWWLVIYWLVCFEKICSFLIALLNLLYYSLCCLMHIFTNAGGSHCYSTNEVNANTILGRHKVCCKNSSSVTVVCHSKHTRGLNPRPGKQEQSNRNDPHFWHVNGTHITALKSGLQSQDVCTMADLLPRPPRHFPRWKYTKIKV